MQIQKKVGTRFQNMYCNTGQSSGTGETIFPKTESVIDYLEVSWGNCFGFSLDNKSANMGIQNSMKAQIIAKKEACCIMGSFDTLFIIPSIKVLQQVYASSYYQVCRPLIYN